MSAPSIANRSVQEFEAWLNEIRDEATLADQQRAYDALRGVLHTLRDRMPPGEATDLGAQLPTLVRGVYYEAYAPQKTPQKTRTDKQFLETLRANIEPAPEFDIGAAAMAVFACLERHLESGMVDHVIRTLPGDVQELWPEESRRRLREREGAS